MNKDSITQLRKPVELQKLNNDSQILRTSIVEGNDSKLSKIEIKSILKPKIGGLKVTNIHDVGLHTVSNRQSIISKTHQSSVMNRRSNNSDLREIESLTTIDLKNQERHGQSNSVEP